MWISAILGMCTKFSEVTLAVHLREIDDTGTYGSWVSVFTAVAMCCFAFSTILGWGLYGTRCAEFLFGSKSAKPFLIIYALVAILGATMDLGVIWDVAETFNGLMAIPNLIGVFLLSGTVVKLVKNYFSGDEYIPYYEQAKMLSEK